MCSSPCACSSLSSLSFQAKVLLLSRLSHPNLIVLQGYCMEGDKQLLVYDLCANGSLESRLFPSEWGEGGRGGWEPPLYTLLKMRHSTRLGSSTC